MKATLLNYEVDINYECPNCRLVFRLRNNQIPTERATTHVCSHCLEPVTVGPVAIIVEEGHKKQPPLTVVNFSSAKKTLVSLGYGTVWASWILYNIIKNNKLSPNTKATVLVKLALAHQTEDEIS